MKDYFKQINALTLSTRIMVFICAGVVFLSIGYVVSMAVVNGFATNSGRSESKAIKLGAVLVVLVVLAGASAFKSRLMRGRPDSK